MRNQDISMCHSDVNREEMPGDEELDMKMSVLINALFQSLAFRQAFPRASNLGN